MGWRQNRGPQSHNFLKKFARVGRKGKTDTKQGRSCPAVSVFFCGGTAEVLPGNSGRERCGLQKEK